MWRYLLKIIFIAALSYLLQGCGDSGDSSGEGKKTLTVSDEGASEFDASTLQKQLDSMSKGTLSDKEKEGLLQMREEEKLARDVYAALFDTYGSSVFNNISKSEQTHMDAVLLLLQRYDLEDPVTDDSRGSFKSTVLRSLYTSLLEKGSVSENEALLVGAEIEELDIYDLNQLESQIEQNGDIALIYSNLKKGSRNHLRAFDKKIKAAGLSYTAKYLSQDEVDAVISSEMENG